MITVDHGPDLGNVRFGDQALGDGMLAFADGDRLRHLVGEVQAIARPQNGVQGLLSSRGYSTDLALAGPGFFAVSTSSSTVSPQGAPDDESLFTRDGSFAADNRGYLVNTSGHYLLANKPDGSSGLSPVNINAQGNAQGEPVSGVEISTDGRVTALFDGGERRPVARIPVATFTNPSGLSADSGGVYRATDASGAPTYQEAGVGGAGSVQSGALELSTTDLGTEFVNLIVAESSYRASLEVLKAADALSKILIDETA